MSGDWDEQQSRSRRAVMDPTNSLSSSLSNGTDTSSSMTALAVTTDRHSVQTTGVKGRSFNKSRSIGNVLGHLFSKSNKSNSNGQVQQRRTQRGRSLDMLDPVAGQSLKNKSLSIGNVQDGGLSPRKSKTMGRNKLNKSRSIGNVQAGHSPHKSKTLSNSGNSSSSTYRYKLSLDGRVPPLPNFGRVSSAGSCGLRERPSSSSPRPFLSSSLQPSPLFLSRCSLSSQTSQSSITTQVLDIAESLGISTSLQYLVEDAKKLHEKLMALSLEMDLDKAGLLDEVESIGGEEVDERMSQQAWKEKSASPFECVCVCVCV